MQILELSLLGLTYTILSIALFLSVLCYTRKIENIETIIFISSLLILIISISSSALFEPNRPENSTNVMILISMILVSCSTFFDVLAERKHRIPAWFKKLYLAIGIVLAALTLALFFVKKIALVQPIVVAFLIASVVGAMLILKFFTPKRRYAHQVKINSIYAIGFGIFIPSYLILLFVFEEQYNNLQIGFLLPVGFSIMGVNKIYDDLKRLSLLRNKTDPKKQQFTNYGLTEREEEVAELLTKGKTYQEISEQLFVSIPTVKTHAGNIYKKCKVKSRHELTILITR